MHSQPAFSSFRRLSCWAYKQRTRFPCVSLLSMGLLLIVSLSLFIHLYDSSTEYLSPTLLLASGRYTVVRSRSLKARGGVRGTAGGGGVKGGSGSTGTGKSRPETLSLAAAAREVATVAAAKAAAEQSETQPISHFSNDTFSSSSSLSSASSTSTTASSAWQNVAWVKLIDVAEANKMKHSSSYRKNFIDPNDTKQIAWGDRADPAALHHLVFHLKQTRSKAFAKLLQSRADPNSRLYNARPEDILHEARHKEPDPVEYQRVRDYLQHQPHVEIFDQEGPVINVKTTISSAEKFLNTHFHVVQHKESGKTVHRCREVYLPEDIAPIVYSISYTTRIPASSARWHPITEATYALSDEERVSHPTRKQTKSKKSTNKSKGSLFSSSSSSSWSSSSISNTNSAKKGKAKKSSILIH